MGPAAGRPPRRRAGTGAPSPGSSSPVARVDGDLRALPVLEASPNAIVAVDRDGVIVYANPQVEAAFGWTPGELLGEPIERLIPLPLHERHAAHRSGYSAHPTARPMGIGLDLAARRRDGTLFPVEISLVPIATPGGQLVFATIVDITTRKALEAQLLQAQKMESVGRLAGGISHDFNNMLFAIRGYVDLLLEDLDAPDLPLDRSGVRASVQAIGTAADKATALTAQLLSFSRRGVVDPRTLDVREAVVGLQPMLRRLIGEDVRLVLALHEATGRIRGDAGQIDQILVNLVVNARDAMPDGGTITIETANVVFDEPYALEHFEVEVGAYVMLAVSDTGSGMDQETRRHVFEPFFTTKEPGKGTGLGLATTYGIVRQGGGHIWLYSEPGRGTTFKIYFPRVDALHEAVVAPPAAAPAARRRLTVLLAEDEPAVRDLTRRVLERAGYEVVAPADPREALLVAESGRGRFDVLVTDLVMPGISGAELARRTLAARPGVAIVLLSGYSTETAEVEGLVRAGASFASKPLATRDLTRIVAEAISRSTAQSRARSTGRSRARSTGASRPRSP